MKQSLLLKHYLYSIPASSLALPAVTKKSNSLFPEHLPLMKVVFDFENGNLTLEGDWQFIVAANKHSEATWFNYHRERISIDAAICPALPINLADAESDGLILSLEGYIEDGGIFGSCSGLLMVDKTWGSKRPQWVISFYLYDLQYTDCEIKFSVPVFIPSSAR